MPVSQPQHHQEDSLSATDVDGLDIWLENVQSLMAISSLPCSHMSDVKPTKWQSKEVQIFLVADQGKRRSMISVEMSKESFCYFCR
ncbi:hypothetical protein Scep_021872 [Stephania cephalantha]|uniref:Uncharacterized protein n=1 Tax=Stephania cephalantha TaxID=152367 RepID=A0AAP0HX77_9MAGN